MGETRVNLKHLLEDIRDSYPFQQEEAIITELIANALDSGASRIRFLIDPSLHTFSIVDNGQGMSQKDFEEYHDIASSGKIRGKGIGFAGIGAKLSLLLSENVVTETRDKTNHKSTTWRLDDSQHATWSYINPQNMVQTPTGTAVTFFISNKDSDLLKPAFVEDVIRTHFYPLLHDEFAQKILKHIYKQGIQFSINQAPVRLSQREGTQPSKTFYVKLGKKGKPVGIGFLIKSKEELSEKERGLAISTYGKVIKRGWDWLGIIPRNPSRLTGIVEIPQLSEILTLNKADFLRDANSLQKYYHYRKAIQVAIEPILQELGEISSQRDEIERDLRPLQKQIEKVLNNIIPEFPELNPLLGRRGRGDPGKDIIPDENAPESGQIVQGVDAMTGASGGGTEGGGNELLPADLSGERIEPSSDPMEKGILREGHRKRPGLMLGFLEDPARSELGWLMDSTIWINKSHSAYVKAANTHSENYHIILCVAWVLSNFLETEKSPLAFLNEFLRIWGQQ